MSVRFVTPSESLPPTSATDDETVPVLTLEQVESWRERGYAVVDGLLPADIVSGCATEAMETIGASSDSKNFGSPGGVMEFPTGLKACDEVPLHPRILSAAAQVLGCEARELRLVHSCGLQLRMPSSVQHPLSYRYLWPADGRGC